MGLILCSKTWAATQNNPANWGLDRIDQRTHTLNNSYTTDFDGSDVIIYILDTPLDKYNSEYVNRLVKTIPGDFLPSCSQGNSAPGATHAKSDAKSHGTHITAIAAGSTYGVAKNANIIGIQALRDCGDDKIGTIDGLIYALDKIIEEQNVTGNSLAIANISLSSNRVYPEVSAKIQEIIDTHNVVFVISAGNGNGDACNYSPQSMGGPNSAAIVVGAMNIKGHRWDEGGTDGSNTGSCVDIYAPGVDITSAKFGGGSETNKGTSMAAPFVAGRAALYIQEYNEDNLLTPANVKEAITGYSATHKVYYAPGELGNKLLYINDEYDTTSTTLEFLQCSNNRADYLFEWDANWGTYNEYYTVEKQLEFGSWQYYSMPQAKAWGFNVAGSEKFRLRISYQANGVTSPVYTTSWKTAPSCSGGFNPF
ncbi:MAG: serine protease [Polaribacter sp.]|jgi:serine protease